ncbi:MAG: DUF4956 domain-containing protein [Oscillospiraceae bacterium]|nr:DUF4956 domain-containing protein [Oscillospiraceae bacterium]
MSILDAIKNSVIQGFQTNVTTLDILLSLGVSLLAGLFILLVYKNAQKGVTPSGGFCLTMLLITSISAMIVLTITSNLALSLGMVGALSIVRFRTAIKETTDTAFLFWAVAAGITAGAGFYLITLIGCLFIGAVCIVAGIMLEKSAKSYLLVVRVADSAATDKVEEVLTMRGVHYKLSALTQNAGYIEGIYELALPGKKTDVVSTIQSIAGVNTVSLVDCHKN